MDITTIEANMKAMAETFETKLTKFQAELNEACRKNPNSIAALNNEFLAFKSFVCDGLLVLRNQISALNNGLDRIETHFRRKMLLVHGIPEQPSEDTCSKVVSILSAKCKLENYSSKSITSSYRMGKYTPSNSKPRPIVVKFADASVRTALWKNKAALKGSQVTLSEFLTKSRHKIFMAARQKYGITNCWTFGGMIHIKLPNGTKRKLETMEEFLNIPVDTVSSSI
ncbi:hypothetical protein ACJJTC_000417 [Scirpophaga incertulas]